MTDEQARVMESLGRGRLIFPFREEMESLRAQGNQGPLTADEGSRLKDLTAAYEKIKIKDQWFHSAIQGGELDQAAKVAEEAKEILEELA